MVYQISRAKKAEYTMFLSQLTQPKNNSVTKLLAITFYVFVKNFGLLRFNSKNM